MRSFFATVPKGMEPLLVQELLDLGCKSVRRQSAGVSFAGDMAMAYRVCLWSRLASRLLLPLGRFPAENAEALYESVVALPWEEHLSPDGSLAVDFSGVNATIQHTLFGARKVKDGVVDRLRQQSGRRPMVDLETPDLRINVRLHGNEAWIGLDLSGESLHRRGYRQRGTPAPLKENLAAAILLLAGWPEIIRQGGGLVDPLCGSGTLLIEGAWMAGDVAPGLLRQRMGFSGWLGHDPRLWEELRREATERAQLGLTRLPPIYGFDRDPVALAAATANVAQAGLSEGIRLVQGEVAELLPPFPLVSSAGLLVANPPYGERQGEVVALAALYRTLGERLHHFSGWQAAIFSAKPELVAEMGFSPVEPVHLLFNGPIPCSLMRFDLRPVRSTVGVAPRVAVPQKVSPPLVREAAPPSVATVRSSTIGAGGEMFANRLRKNRRHWEEWAKRGGIDCYRLYDADLPEYAVAIDRYGDWVHLQEYQAPAEVDPGKAEDRLREVLAIIPEVLDIPRNHLFLKVRQRQKGSAQYEKMARREEFHPVQEGGLRFLVNFTDYLDTGLFLDHRLTRQMIRQLAEGKRFLNLFGYTGTATVNAAAGGALSTITVDLSPNYLEWAAKNMALNGFSGKEHRFIQADCREWLHQDHGRYDLIFLDPPTFSNSKRGGAEPFDLQRHHPELIRATVQLLAPGGILIFSTNFRKFRIEQGTLSSYLQIRELSRATLPPDFRRNPRIHSCWRLERLSS